MDISSPKAIDILLVEDNPADVRLTIEAFKDGKIANRLHVARDGVEAMNFLNRLPPYEKAIRPDLILLDLNLPRKNGREVLAEVKQSVVLRQIPIVVLTTSKADEDVVRSYDLHANCYISKPIDFERLIQVVRAIETFWISVVKLPPKE